MLISKQWLAEFVKLPKNVSDAALAERLTLSTVEVEGVVSQSEAWEHIVVGVIRSISAHPNADRLKICQVDVGAKETVQIVCGGKNVAEGMKVVAALPGARVRWHGEGDLVELAETKIRGEKSFGMICASVEIGLENAPEEGEHDIRPLTVDAKPGTPLAQALGRSDTVFEIDNKSLTNRPDLVGHYGMAREIAALYGEDVKPYEPPAVKSGKGWKLSIDVEDASACPRYMGVVIEGVEVGPSPAWLADRLTAVGMRAINNVVDVTNYVMAEAGQSLHAFDADVIKSGDAAVDIVVRKAKKGEMLTTLDEVERKLDPSMLLICDKKKPLVIAGIKGGLESGVTDNTKTIFLESANFDATTVRKTSQALALRSDASMRYEKSLDPELSDVALRRAIELLKQLHPNAKIVSTVVDAYPKPPKSVSVVTSFDWIRSRLGAEISDKEIKDILARLGFAITDKRSSINVTVPSWRATKDIGIPEDIVEEVARIWGYERIVSALPEFPVAPPAHDPVRALTRRVRHVLSGRFAATEAYLYAFASPATLEVLGLRLSDHVKLANPLSDERPYLVRSLAPNLLESVAGNQHRADALTLFQIDRVFDARGAGEENGNKGTLPAQPHHVAMAVSRKGDDAPLREASRIVSGLLLELGYEATFTADASEPWMHTGRAAQIRVGGTVVGSVAEVTPIVAGQLGIDRRVAVAEWNLDSLAAIAPKPTSYHPIPEFPPVMRDLAFVVSDASEYVQIEAALRQASDLLVRVELFDVYRGKGVEAGKKSVAVHLTFQADKTLSSEEADAQLHKLIGVIERQFHGTIRA